MNKIKILMVLGSTNMGGAQIFILNLLKNMDLSRFQVDFAVNFDENYGGIGTELKAMGCHIYKLPYFRVYNYIHFKRSWQLFLKEHQYDIVHGHSTNSASVYLKVAKKMGCITIAHCHSAGFRGNKLQQLFKIIFARKIRTAAEYWFACSDIAAQHLYGDGYKLYDKYYNIPNAIIANYYLYNNEVAKKIRTQFDIKEDVFLCGHVGSFTAPKNHAFLLKVFKEILQRVPNAKLICCGAGILQEQVKENALSMGILEHIIFTGVVKNVNEFMMAMDLLIFPSLFEGFPVTIIESEATGLPVLMSDIITDEVDLTDCIHRMSLDSSPADWANKACSIQVGNRVSYHKIIRDSKYNMSNSVNTVISLYDKMITNNY